MFVDVVPMRHRGEKLSQTILAMTDAVHGDLTIVAVPWRPLWAPNEKPQPTRLAKLQKPGAKPDETLLPPLRDARIERMKGNDFVVFGTEDLGSLSKPESFPQSWWCRLIAAEQTDVPGNGLRL
ncbi:hypothetical protein [Rhizobacter fulvus]